ncbi:hypothetical protein BGZ81_004083 [Podila clonocystis]|nr:hypothetical protein BGZ81_004083 [Podila clonocystis]
MTEQEYSQAIRSSSNKVLHDLLARNDQDIQELTVRQHKVKLLTWKYYCDAHYDGDYTVNAEHMLPYFEDLVFRRTSKKFVVPDIGYDGVIGLRPVGWKPPNPKRQRAAKQNTAIEEWIPESSTKEQDQQVWTPDDADAAIARSEELEQEVEQEEEHEPADNMDFVMGSTRDDDNNSVEITAQEELQALHAMVEGEDEAGLVLEGEDLGSKDQQELEHSTGTEASAEPCIIETEADKMKGHNWNDKKHSL